MLNECSMETIQTQDTRSTLQVKYGWVKPLGFFLRFSLGLWNDRCDTLHGANEEETRRIKKTRIVEKVERCYSDKDLALPCFWCMFRTTLKKLCKKSTQYLYKWVTSCRLVPRKRPQKDPTAEGDEKKKTKKKRRRKSVSFSGFPPTGPPCPYSEYINDGLRRVTNWGWSGWGTKRKLGKPVERLGGGLWV